MQTFFLSVWLMSTVNFNKCIKDKFKIKMSEQQDHNVKISTYDITSLQGWTYGEQLIT